MTTLELNAELYRAMGEIADDETLMAKVLKYVKKLAAKKQTMDETEYIMSSPRMVPRRSRLLETDGQQAHHQAYH